MSKAANAVLALARSFYGKRLEQKQYDDLLACKSINEAAAYLRTKTVYSDVFDGVQLTGFTSGTLEEIVNKHSFLKFVSLCRYELAIGSDFYKYFLVKTEVEQILNATLLMIGGKTEEYLLEMNSFLDRHLGIDLYALGRANSLEGIAASLEKTPYGKIYTRCLSDPEKSYLTFELAFDNYFLKYKKHLVDTCFNGGEKKAMREMICREFDMLFIAERFRTICFYGSNAFVTKLIAPSDISMTMLSAKKVNALLNAKTKEDFAEALKSTPYESCAASLEPEDVETSLYKNFYSYCRKRIRFSTYPGEVMYAYLFLVQNETMNIVKIIEGIKYSIPQEQIKQSLVFSHAIGK